MNTKSRNSKSGSQGGDDGNPSKWKNFKFRLTYSPDPQNGKYEGGHSGGGGGGGVRGRWGHGGMLYHFWTDTMSFLLYLAQLIL